MTSPTVTLNAQPLVLRPNRWQAEHAYRYVGTWLADIRDHLQRRVGQDPPTVVIDLSEAYRLDFAAIGLLFEKLARLGARTHVTGAAPHLVVSLQTVTQLPTLRGADITIDEPRPPATGALATQPQPLTVNVPGDLLMLLRVRARRWQATPDEIVASALRSYLSRSIT